KCLQRLIDRALNAGLVCHVRVLETRALAELASQALARGPVHVGHDHPRASGGESPRTRRAESRSATADEKRLPAKLHSAVWNQCQGTLTRAEPDVGAFSSRAEPPAREAQSH